VALMAAFLAAGASAEIHTRTCSGAPKCALYVNVKLLRSGQQLVGARVLIKNTSSKTTPRILVEYVASNSADTLLKKLAKFTVEKGKLQSKFDDPNFKVHTKWTWAYYFAGLRPGRSIVYRAMYKPGVLDEKSSFDASTFVLFWNQASSDTLDVAQE
jgi:hypothetical protein